MTLVSWVWFLIGACVIYAVAVDENVFHWLVLQSKAIKLWFERLWFRIRYNPDSPLVRYEIKRNADKMAREIIKELKNR